MAAYRKLAHNLLANSLLKTHQPSKSWGTEAPWKHAQQLRQYHTLKIHTLPPSRSRKTQQNRKGRKGGQQRGFRVCMWGRHSPAAGPPVPIHHSRDPANPLAVPETDPAWGPPGPCGWDSWGRARVPCLPAPHPHFHRKHYQGALQDHEYELL